jgi:hypothetical protein
MNGKEILGTALVLRYFSAYVVVMTVRWFANTKKSF